MGLGLFIGHMHSCPMLETPQNCGPGESTPGANYQHQTNKGKGTPRLWGGGKSDPPICADPVFSVKNGFIKRTHFSGMVFKQLTVRNPVGRIS